MTMQRDYSLNLQWIAASLSFVINICLLVLGCSLFIFPTIIIQTIFHCLAQDTVIGTLENSLARLTGGILISHSLSCTTLCIPLLRDVCCNKDNIIAIQNVDKCRACLAAHSVVGLLLVLTGLMDDRLNRNEESCGPWQSLWLLAGGASMLVLAGTGLMVSFWPLASYESINERRDDMATTQSCSCHRNRSVSVEDQNNHFHVRNDQANGGDEEDAPLLDPVNGSNGSYQLLESDAEQPPHNTTTNGDDTIAAATEESSSRLTGTRRLLKLATTEVVYLYLGCAVLLVRLPFSLSIPHFVSTALGALSHNDYNGARLEILLLFILGTIDAALDFWCVFLFGYANQRILRGVRTDLFRSIFRQEVAFFDKNTSGELSSRLNADCGQMASDLTWFFRFSIESVVRITGITVYMLIRSPKLGGAALCIIPVVAAVNKLYGEWLRKNAIACQDAMAAANSVALEALSCVRTVIGFAAEDLEHRKYSEKIENHYLLNVRQLYMSGVYFMSVSTFLINTVVQATLLLLGTHLIEKGRLTPEILLAFMLYQGQLQNETMNLFNSYSSLIKSSGAGDKVCSLLDLTPLPPGTGSLQVQAHEHNPDATASVVRKQCSILLRDVTFRYPSRPEQRVLNGINLTISVGKTVALVGPSGCGKSTILALLQRFYDPNSGSITVNDVDLSLIDVKAHRRSVGIVTQDPALFSGSILSNITYGLPSATLEEAIRAAKVANAHDFITSLPNGYETEVGERGVQLSGGQKQRITIARAIIKNPSLLLLDEATSALDGESEQVVQDALDHLPDENKDMTIVVVAHRLRTVRNADCIAYIEGGRVVEMGTHDELVQRFGGHYRKMVDRAGTSGLLPDK